MGDREFFTIVFKGDITKLPFNPMKIDTPFGRPIASGMGHAFERLDAIEEIEDAARKLVAISDKLSK